MTTNSCHSSASARSVFAAKFGLASAHGEGNVKVRIETNFSDLFTRRFPRGVDLGYYSSRVEDPRLGGTRALTGSFSFADGAALQAFSEWLCEEMRSHPEARIRIGRKEVGPDREEVMEAVRETLLGL